MKSPGELLSLVELQARVEKRNMINLNELSSTLGVAVQTVKNYLTYAEKTFVVKRGTPYFRNIRRCKKNRLEVKVIFNFLETF